MNLWLENSGSVPTHNTGILYETVTPNKKHEVNSLQIKKIKKKHEVLHKNPEVETERPGQWYSWIRAERNVPCVFMKVLSSQEERVMFH